MAATGNSCFWLADFLKSSPLKPLGQMNRNLVGSIYGMSSMKIAHFVPIVNKHGYHRNLVGIIYGMSSIKIAHFVPIG
jgi:membrane protein DedA with SNARE-associated domain